MKIVVSGYYGFGNAGDEAVLEAMLRDLRAQEPGARIVVLSGDPAMTEARYGVESVSRTHVPSVLRALRGAGLFVSGGGSLLQDATGWASVPYYTGLMWLARLLGVPVFVYAQGVGPLRRPWLRRLAARALNAAAGVTVRDRLSYETLLKLGVNSSLMSVTADPVFGLTPGGTAPTTAPVAGADFTVAAAATPGDSPSSLPSSSREDSGRNGEPRLIGVCLRPLPGDGAQRATNRLVDALAEALRPRLAAWNASVVPLALHDAVDGPVLERLVSKLSESGEPPRVAGWSTAAEAASDPGLGAYDRPANYLRASQWIRLFSRLELCVTMRLHGLVFAACAGTPSVALSDDPKVAAHVDELGLTPESCLLEPDAASPRMLGDVLDRAWRERADQRNRLRKSVPELAARARLTAARALAGTARS